MADEAARMTEYVVLKRTAEAKPGRDGLVSMTSTSDPEPATLEAWEVLATVTASSSDTARRNVVRGDIENLKGATLVAVPTQSWKPQKPKVRQPEPVIEFEDA